MRNEGLRGRAVRDEGGGKTAEGAEDAEGKE